MELGATVCRPLNPDCEACPVRSVCRADAEWKAYLEDGGAPDIEDAPHVTQVRPRTLYAAFLDFTVFLCSYSAFSRCSSSGTQAAKPFSSKP